ncbi:hypothetical protein EI94DRAFT_1714111 [Lactarius quietus]|nr:hypothetical protein EI94DRAFT_1714111 [Lactarius quietus]
MAYIPSSALAGLRNYRYKGVDKSLLSNYVLNPFWTWFVTLWPTWVAPNLITLSGLAIVLFNFASLSYYDPTYLTEKGGATGPPNWLYFTWGIGLFMYQTLDAIDGKQARRTGMAGPLGEMFDHEYHTGQIYLSVFSGPVEGILIIVTIFMITGFYGPSFWDQKILTFTRLENVEWIASRIPNVALNTSFMIFAAFGLAFNIVMSYINVFIARRASGGPVFKPLLYLIPFPVSVLVHVAWLNHPRCATLISSTRPLCPFPLRMGPAVCACRWADDSRAYHEPPFPVWDWMYIWTIIGAIDANMPILFGRAPLIQHSPENTEKFVFVVLVVAIVTYARFVLLVISDITNYLGIACLTVRKKDARGVSSEKRV